MRRPQLGFLLIAAVVIIVIAGVMAAVIATLVAGSATAGARHMRSTQAFYVATSGLEHAARLLNSPSLAERLPCGGLTTASSLIDATVGEGRFTATTAVRVYTSAAATLNAALSASAVTTIAFTSGAAPPDFGMAAAGRVLIDREAIDYASIGTCGASPCFLGVQRGRDGTAIVAHASGTRIGQYQCDVTVNGGAPTLTATDRGQRTLAWGVQTQEGWTVAGNGAIFRWNDAAWTNFGTPVAAQLNSVSMLSYVDGWAVGNRANGSGVALQWNGSAWTRVTGGIPNANLNGVYCLASADCWIAGNNQGGFGVAMRWTGGPNWTRVTGGIPNANLNSVYCVASNDCWIVGDVQGPAGIALHWTGGPNWNRVTAGVSNTNLNSVYCVASNDCWMAGDGGLTSHWNGTAWSTIASGVAANLNNVYCNATNDCWIAGNAQGGAGVILHWTGGPNWTRPQVAGIPNVNLNGVHCVAADDCWVVGNNVLFGGGAGEVLLHWDGASWTRIGPTASLPNQPLRSVYFVGSRQRADTAWREVFP